MKLVVFSDLHYISEYYKHPDLDYNEFSEDFIERKNEFFKFAIDSIFKEDADLYISLGDLTNFGTYDEVNELYKYIDETGKEGNFINVLGNHDLYTYSADDLTAMLMKDYDYKLDYDNVRLIFLKTALDTNYEDFGGYLDDNTIDWLKRNLNKDDKPCLVFSHHPIYDTVRKSSKELRYIRPADKIQDIVESKSSGKVVFFSGHTHSDSIVQKTNWTYLGLGSYLDYPKYLTVEIRNDIIDIKFKEIQLNDRLESTRRKIGEIMPYFEFTSDVRAGKENQEITIDVS